MEQIRSKKARRARRADEGGNTDYGYLDDPRALIIRVLAEKPQPALVYFPKNTSGVRKFDFSPFFNQGANEITAALMKQVLRFIDGKDRKLQAVSVITICRLGVTSFMTFLAAESRIRRKTFKLECIDKALVEQYIKHLNTTVANPTARRRTYSTVKTLLLSMASRGLLDSEGLLPENPFPTHLAPRRKPVEAYSQHEVRSIARALKHAVAPLFDPNTKLTAGLLSRCLLAISLRTGQNLTPLIELSYDCLRPHFKEGHRLLVLSKRRSGRAVQVTVSEPRPEIVGAIPETVAIIERLRDLTSGLRSSAPAELRDRLMIYARTSNGRREILGLTPSQVTIAARDVERRNDLRSTSGERLLINVARLRKTFVNRIYEVTGGDVNTAAVVAGHNASVTERHYLVPSSSAASQWRFMGEMLATELRGELGKTSDKTPVGGCRDSLRGEYAPKDGSLCTRFLNCIRCRHYVVTGDDLYKLFSFYWRVVRERKDIAAATWRRRYGAIIRTIDRDVIGVGIERGVFTPEQVAHARREAERAPHPYWRSSVDLGSGA